MVTVGRYEKKWFLVGMIFSFLDGRLNVHQGESIDRIAAAKLTAVIIHLDLLKI